MAAEPDEVLALVIDLFDQLKPTAALAGARYLHDHPEDVAGFLSLVSHVGREMIDAYAREADRAVPEVLDSFRDN